MVQRQDWEVRARSLVIGAIILGIGFAWGHHTATTQCVDMAFQLLARFGISEKEITQLIIDLLNR